MIDHWLRFVWKVSQAQTLLISGVRKIAQDLSFEMPYEVLLKKELTFEDIGYTRAKFRQLARNYWNEEEATAAVEKLVSRKDKPHSSVSIQLKGGEKDSRSQGQCMQNMVITYAPFTKEICTVDVYYRSTEVLQKFLADLIFFAEVWPVLFERLGYQPSVVRFKFANTYLSAVFAPIFIRYEPKPVAFLKNLEHHDPRFHRTFSLATSKFFQETHNYSYRTRVKMFDYAKEHISDSKMASLRLALKGIRGEVPEEEEGDED